MYVHIIFIFKERIENEKITVASRMMSGFVLMLERLKAVL
jgi:hypothetical protein